MRWEGGQESGNVEDRRGLGGTGMVLGGGSAVILLIGYLLGFDPSQILQLLGGGHSSGGQTQSAPPQNDRTKRFIATVVGFTEKVWDEQFQKMGKTYRQPKLVIFDGQVDTDCGRANSAVGPFYCPADKTVYIDPGFYDELEQRLGGSKAEFSQAYVIAHEIGHHVQGLLGYGEIVERKRRELSKEEFNRWSVRLELQADYLAGVWAHHGQQKFNFIEKGDVEEAIKSANAIGDDKLQKRMSGRVSPQNFTHGTAEQRVRWYTRGLQTGDMTQVKALFELPYDRL